MKLTKENYVEHAEKVMKEICSDKNGKNIVTTSKIRNILSMVSEIYNEARRLTKETLDSEMISKIQYLKMHVAYDAGRENSVRSFVEKAGIFQAIDGIGRSRENLIVFCHYMEALVAYRKYLGGKDEN
ncbi:MAG: type III-A CRISPR-associated protein Csm2 [Anaerobutyricum sp.]|nr:type III-A CRISPR-associated protein Csm2 [Anaerobutyricum sp.]